MIFRNWFNRFSKKNKKPTITPVAPAKAVDIANIAQEEKVGLNFKTAIEAHQNWKKRLTSVVDGSSAETLHVDIVSRDDQCLLGKWIHSTGAENFSSLEEFSKLKKNHAHFHSCAGHVLQLAQKHDNDKAMKELKDGQYAKASQQVVRDLVSVYTHVTH